ncbi:MAG TPA: hypothetical protein DCF43_09030 [Pseudomonas sp.]|nr:hypothetical protein [Pseudomonas sp.]
MLLNSNQAHKNFGENQLIIKIDYLANNTVQYLWSSYYWIYSEKHQSFNLHQKTANYYPLLSAYIG